MLLPYSGNPFYRGLIHIGYLSVSLPASFIGLTALHVPYEYKQFFENAGLKLKWEEFFRKFNVGPTLYKTSAAVKTDVSGPLAI